MISSIARGATSALAEAALAATPLAAAPAKAARTPATSTFAQAVLASAAGAVAKPKRPKVTASSKSRTASSGKATGYAKASAAKASGTSKTSKTSTAKTSTSKTSTAKATGELAFLDDPRISTEEKLFRFMMHVMDKYDRDLEQKMKEAGGKGTSASGGTTTTTTKKKSNPFSKVASAIKTLVPGAGIALETLNNKNLQSLLKTISGPALAAGATALGMPALAPILAKAGPQLAGVAFDLAKAIDDPGTSTTTTSSKTTGGSTAGAGGDPEIDRKKVMELQYAMEKQKEMFSLVSNILRSMHDMKMVAVHNVRA